MNTSIDNILTPYKYGAPVVAPSGEEGAFDRLSVDVPTVFRHGDHVYMMHVGFDGTGYQTALCVAEDDTLLRWRHLGVILRRSAPGRWDSVGRAGTCIISDCDLHGERRPIKVNGRYWLLYHAYPGEGYETGAAEIGIAWCEDESLLDWHCLEQPIYSWRDGGDWEKGGLYKCWVTPANGRYYMFYNAKNVTEGNWREQTGCAVSDDLLNWQRVPGNPVLPVTGGAWDSKFASDPMVLRDEQLGRWIMFYFGFDGIHAQDGVAFSDDLINWRKHPEPILRYGAPGELDSTHAHKPAMLWHNGMLYHFYCAVCPPRDESERRFGGEYRVITVARSHPFE